MTPRPIIIDCDPGIDDATAILLAIASPEFDILGITTVHGNVPVEQTTKNALAICALAGRPDIPVFQGCDRPLLRPMRTATFIHGQTGLGELVLPEPVAQPQARHAVDFIIDTVAASARPVTIFTLGPQTNIGVALAKAPWIAQKVERIVFMGGAMLQRGNMPNTTTFNVFTDPHAQQILLNSGADLVGVLIDVTHRVRTTSARMARIRAIGTRCAEAVATMFEPHARKQEAMPADSPVLGTMHDPCAIAAVLKPDLLSGRRVHMAVETGSELTMGVTIVDWWGRADRAPNALILNDIHVDGFHDLLAERLARLP